MKKQIICAMTVCALLVSNSALAATVSKSFGGFNINVTTPNTTSSKTVQTSANTAAMKAQIDAVTSKVNSLSTNYQNSINSLANNLLPTAQIDKLKEEKEKLQKASKSTVDVNIEIAEDGTIALNKFLKTSSAKETFKNLSVAQKTAIKKDLNNLASVSSSYSQIIEQSKTLAKQIKADPVAAMNLKADIINLTKVQINAAKQVKNITKLSANIVTSASKAGVSIK